MKHQVTLKVNFDPAKLGYGPKENISGKVHVRADVDCTITCLDVHFLTHDVETHARMGEKSAQPVSNFPMNQGQEKSFPFLFLPPADPYEWSDSRESADWFVEARMEIQPSQPQSDSFELEETKGYRIMERPENARSTDSDLPKTNRKRAVKDQSATLGQYISAILISLIFWGIAYLGLTLTMNGYSDRLIPEGVRYFGLVAMLGGFFVVGKLYSALGKGISYLSSAISMAISLLAFYAFSLGPKFDITRFNFLVEAPKSILFSSVSAPQILFAITGFAMLVQSSMFFYAKNPKKNGLLELSLLIPGYCFAVLGISIGLASLAGVEVEKTKLYSMLLLGVIGLVVVGTSLRRPTWNNLPKGMTLLAAAPLFFVGTMQLPHRLEALMPEQTTYQWLLSSFLFLGGTLILIFGNRNLVAAIQLGKVDAAVHPQTVAPGGFVEASVKFQPLKSVLINGITARLICYRSRNLYRGGKIDREDWVDYDATTVEVIGRVVAAGENVEKMVQIAFPAGCERTASDCNWELRLRIDAARAIDWEEIYPIEVS